MWINAFAAIVLFPGVDFITVYRLHPVPNADICFGYPGMNLHMLGPGYRF